MWPKLLNLLLIVLISTSTTNGVRRKSKIDLPIANAADAPFADNIAQSSNTNQQQQQVTKNEATASGATEKPTNSIASAAASAAAAAAAATNGNPLPATAALSDSTSSENDGIECDPDMIGFEIITGLVIKFVETFNS